MFDTGLRQAVEDFGALMLPLSEKDLERQWVWKDHDEEGIRFAFFVTLQELRDLAVTLSRLRPNLTAAQLILGQYHAAYMDLQAALLGLSNEAAEPAPAEGEWSVQRAYAHVLGTDINFTIVVLPSKGTGQAHGHLNDFRTPMQIDWRVSATRNIWLSSRVRSRG